MRRWSKQISFKREAITKNVPETSGVYKILQSFSYPRYFQTTHILKIGMSKTSLQKEVLNHFVRHTVANRLSRIRKRTKIKIFVRWHKCSPSDAVKLELALLKNFEDNHWDLPILNSKRGYKRGDNNHYAN